MRSRICLVGGDLAHLASSLTKGADVAQPSRDEDLAGADVVVVGDGAAVASTAAGVARRAPAAVLLLATGSAERDCAAALEIGRLPRTHVVGVAPDDAQRAAEAALRGRGVPFEAAVLCRGELGIDDRVATVPLLLGAGGVERIGPYA